jgi:hypothetical protein
MRRLLTLVAALVMAGGMALATTAAPAQASPPSYPNGTLQGVYFEHSFCQSRGTELVQNGPWVFYTCDLYMHRWFLHTFQ